jgi:calcineurin-like phosphoesterase family protein
MADPHFDHEGVIEMCARPFANVDEMNECLIHGINSTVPRKDELIIVGDFAWRNPGRWRQRINVKNVHLIMGNHDRANYAKHFSIVRDVRMYRLGPERYKCWASHYPHVFWPASHYGSFHVYGHCHWQREEYLDVIWPKRRSMDVGIDAAYQIFGEYRPFSELEIIELLQHREGHHDVNHERYVQGVLNAELSAKTQ